MHQPPKCPKCGSIQTSRSHRKLIERLVPRVRPYRCGNCSSRFFNFRGFFGPK